MSNFIPTEYVDVAERIHRFYERHPDGSIQTSMERLDDGLVVFKAYAFRSADDRLPTTGYAYEREGQGHVNKTSFIENCETSAIGRALANMGFAVKSGEPRPSRQEMEKVQRMATEAFDLEPHDAPASSGEKNCPKCGGKMWDNRENKRNPKAPDFKCRDTGCDGVIWPPKKKAPAPAPVGSPFTPDDDDLPF